MPAPAEAVATEAAEAPAYLHGLERDGRDADSILDVGRIAVERE